MKEQLRHWLLIRGNEQDDWFPSQGQCDTHDTHDRLKVDETTLLEDSLSKMSIAPLRDPRLQEMRSINDEITHLTSAFLALTRSESVADPLLRNLMILVDRQNFLIKEYISLSPVANISNTLRIWRPVKRCKFLVDMVAISIAESNEYERALKNLLESVRQLNSVFESFSV